MKSDKTIAPAPGRVLTTTEEAVLALQPMLENIDRIDAATADDIVLQILQAETLEDAFERAGAPSLQNWEGQSLLIEQIRWGESGYAEAFPVMLIIDAKDGAGKAITASTSSGAQVAQLVKAHALGRIPGLLVIPRRAERPTRNGFYPWRLELVIS